MHASTGGIGRELYSAPFIWISSNDCNIKEKDGKNYTVDTFSVVNIKIENKKITQLVVINDKTGEIVFEWSLIDYDKPIGKDKLDTIKALNVDALKAKEVLSNFGYTKSSEIKVRDFQRIFTKLKEIINED